MKLKQQFQVAKAKYECIRVDGRYIRARRLYTREERWFDLASGRPKDIVRDGVDRIKRLLTDLERAFAKRDRERARQQRKLQRIAEYHQRRQQMLNQIPQLRDFAQAAAGSRYFGTPPQPGERLSTVIYRGGRPYYDSRHDGDGEDEFVVAFRCDVETYWLSCSDGKVNSVLARATAADRSQDGDTVAIPPELRHE